MRNHEALRSAVTSDVIIIGGGVIGLAIARALALLGMKSITLIERARIGAEASYAAAGMLAPQAEADRPDLFFELACASRDRYPAFAHQLLEETGTDIELETTGTLYLAFTAEDEEEIEGRYYWQTRTALPVERLTAEETRRLEPCISPEVRAALRFPLDVQVENRRLIAALSDSIAKRGVRVLTGTDVKSLTVERGGIKGVETSRGPVQSPVVVVACGAWTSFLNFSDKATSPVGIEPVRGQMLCFETNPRLAQHVIYSPRGYIVPRLDGRVLAGSTTEYAGFDKRVTGAGLQAITSNALEIAPPLGGMPVVDSWAGLRPRAEDEWPVMGASGNVSGLFYATGHYRNGILLAPLTAELVADQIMTGRTSPFLDSFSPDRFDFVSAN